MMEIEIIWGEIKIRILHKLPALKSPGRKRHIVCGPDSQELGNFHLASVKWEIGDNFVISLLFPLLHTYDGNRNYLGRNTNSNSS